MKTDKIKFQKRKTKFQLTTSKTIKLNVLDIIINGKNLINILKEEELLFAKKEGHKEITGGYEGLAVDYTDIKNHFLGKPEPIYKYKNKVQILECPGCREPGCWPMLIKITKKNDKIIWSDFEQPHRKKWKYNLKFVFNNTQYKSALTKIK